MKRLFLSILTIGVICFGADEVLAQCTCEPKPTVQDHFNHSDVVFVGKVVEAKKMSREKPYGYDAVIRLEVKQVWKRDLEQFVTVWVYGNTNSFEPDAEFLLYANKTEDGTLKVITICCSGTKLLSVATERRDLWAFKKMGEKPRRVL